MINRITNHKNTKIMNTNVAKVIFKSIKTTDQPKGLFVLQEKIQNEKPVLFYDGVNKTKDIILYNRVWHCSKELSELFSFYEIAEAIIYNHNL